MSYMVFFSAYPRRQGTPLSGSLLATGLITLLIFITSLAPSARAGNSVCHHDAHANSQLVIDTSAGSLSIRLFNDTAPRAVAELLDLVAGNDDPDTAGFFDGLTFDYTRPHVEIRTAAHPERTPVIPIEIDADALGLHQQELDSATAMSVIQNELIIAYRKSLRGSELTPQLERWLAQWYEEHDASFLVGTTRKAVNEALGYTYISGRPSRPVRKGSVALVPASKQSASAQLSIALSDLSRRDGRWMVIGEVTKGLELAERIAIAPLDTPPNTKRTGWRPKDPVVIKTIRQTCADDDTL